MPRLQSPNMAELAFRFADFAPLVMSDAKVVMRVDILRLLP